MNNAEYFKGMLKQKGFNVSGLAEAIGITVPMTSNRINGSTPWEWERVLQVCDVLDITLEQFENYFPLNEKKHSNGALRGVDFGERDPQILKHNGRSYIIEIKPLAGGKPA